MNVTLFLRRKLAWLNIPSVMLIALLQRTPILKVGTSAECLAGTAPLGALLRSAVAGATALGAMVTMAGATELATSVPSPNTIQVGTATTIAFSITGTTSGADNWITSGSVPPGMSFSGTASETLILSGTPTTPGNYVLSITATDAIGGSTPAYSYTVIVAGAANVAPSISTQPTGRAVAVGASTTFTAAASGTPAPTFQWTRNGRNIAGATGATYTVTNVQPADAGIYAAVATNAAGAATSDQAILGVQTSELFVGTAFSDPAWRTIQHTNGNSYTQILLTGPAATVTADPGKVTRISYVDLQDDIVQLEFSGPGTMTVTLDNPSGPATPAKYVQPTVQYMRGHATVVIQGAGSNTFFSAFSVGSLTAVNQALFRTDVTYDGHADLARLLIHSPTGEFGGLFMGNAAFNDTNGFTGVYAPGIMIHNNIRLHDLAAFDSARPVLIFGPTMNAENGLRVNGGDLLQPNGRAIEIRGAGKVIMGSGTDSHGRSEAAQTNRAKFENAGADVTSSVVVNP